MKFETKLRLDEIWSEAAAIRRMALAKYNVTRAMAATSLMNSISLNRGIGRCLANSPEGVPAEYYSNLLAEAEAKLQALQAI